MMLENLEVYSIVQRGQPNLEGKRHITRILQERGENVPTEHFR